MFNIIPLGVSEVVVLQQLPECEGVRQIREVM